MNTHRRIVSAFMALAVAISVWSCRTAPICILYGVPHSFSAAEVAGEWIGFPTNGTDLYRLALRPDSTGSLTEAYTSITNQEMLTFAISRWDIATNNVLTCTFPQYDTHDPVIMTCRVTGTRLEASLRNGEGGWRENILFWRERDLDEKLRVLRR
jgi:hypothetical protein